MIQGLLAFALLAFSATGNGAESLTVDQALHLAFPGADRIEKVLVALTSEERAAIAKRIAPREAPRIFRRYVGLKGDEILGYAVVDDAMGKSEPITYLLAVDPSLRVERVEILAYRESHGGDVRQSGWREQFRGKDPGSPMRIGTDIRNIAGATISCRSITDAVHDQLACLAVLPKPSVPAAAAKSADARSAVSPARGSLLRRTRLAMGTTITLSVSGLPEAQATDAMEAAFAEVDRLESILTTWREESDTSRLNRAAGGEAQPCPPELLELLEKSSAWSERTGGTFDVTVGPVVALWKRAGSAGIAPGDGEIDAARTLVDYRRIEVDAKAGRARLGRAGASVDFGGIGKGYALDRAAAVLEARGVHRALLDFGGQFLALDPPEGERAWRVDVRDPARPDSTVGAIGLVRSSISSTADYERGFDVGGKRVSHVVDPRTGRPVEGMLGATVVYASATGADALSTALYVMGAEEGMRYAGERELAARMVDAGGAVRETKDFGALLLSPGRARGN